MWHPLYQQVAKAHAQLERNGSLLNRLYGVLVEQSEYVAAQQHKPKVAPPAINDFATRIPVVTESYDVSFTDDEYNRNCPFGDKFYQLFLKWALKLKWPLEPSNIHVSSLELYVDFCIYHQTRGPVLVKYDESKNPIYHLPTECLVASISNPTLADQHMTWCRFLKWVERQNIPWHNAQKISKSKVLGPLGFSMWVPAFNSHPKLTCAEQAYSTINHLLISSSGKTRSLSVPFSKPPVKHSQS